MRRARGCDGSSIIARTVRAIVAIGGKYGTLCEIAFALKNGVPVVGLNTWKMCPPSEGQTGIIHLDDPLGAAQQALKLAKGANLHR